MTILDEKGDPINAPMSGSWTALIPTLVQVAAKAPQPEAREFAMAQLLKLGEIVDRHIAQLEALAAALPPRDKDRRCPECGVRGGAHAWGCPLGTKADDDDAEIEEDGDNGC